MDLPHFQTHATFSFARGAARLGLLLVFIGSAALWAQPGSPFVSGAWSGNVSPTSGTVCIRLIAPGQRVRLAVSTSEQLTSPVFSPVVTTATGTGNAVKLTVGGLLPNTRYFYGVEVDGLLRPEPGSRGRFRTFPQGAASFKVALVGDTDYRFADHRGADAVLAEDPLLLLYNGDLHYADLTSTVTEDYRVQLDNTTRHPNIGAMLRGAPIAYMWDDHDFAGGDNSDGTAVGRDAIRAAYRECVPHYPLNVGDGTIGQAFTVGRVRVIMTDLRSASERSSNPETNKTRMGVAQKAWFKQELIAARDANFPLVVWLSSVPWIAPAQLGDDSWAGYASEREEIANFIRDNRVRNVVVYAGDMHAMGYDDGEHSDYASGGGAPLIVFHAAALGAPPNEKGGPYSAGPFPGTLQYGLLEVNDTGGTTIQCRVTGKRVGEGAKFVYQFTASALAIDGRSLLVSDPSSDRALINISTRGRIGAPAETLIAGFVIAGRNPRNILLRAVGPSLAAFGVTGALPRPVLTLFKGNTVVASNDDWGLADFPRLTAAFDRAGAFRFASQTSRDAALYLALEPGAYTLQTASGDGSPGNVLVEIYEVP
ncbi:alkaline phosphatase D family protein [Horticoccus sp. 23ND18S-11]|uniref:alkaline phosphatase D family protein n=1 Tax=Horticoccus sp. 23ND18S-11 TaxID=3391832 RepID=UPI0039C944EA